MHVLQTNGTVVTVVKLNKMFVWIIGAGPPISQYVVAVKEYMAWACYNRRAAAHIFFIQTRLPDLLFLPSSVPVEHQGPAPVMLCDFNVKDTNHLDSI